MQGYNPNFLSTPIPLPRFSMALEGRVLELPELQDKVYRNYIHYSVAMHAERRSPVFAALNIDQNQLLSVDRGRWNTDKIIGDDNQMDNDYYYKNRWDRGHLARRASTAWGNSKREAKAASDATMFYTNACLQFDCFNQDEWLALEDWVKHHKKNKGGKITSFSGPIYGDDPLYIAPQYEPAAEIPAAFFKIVCFINEDDELETRAFILPQDKKAMTDWSGSKLFDHTVYQTTVAEVEELTGLVFDDQVAMRNPLYYHLNPEEASRNNIDAFPENIPVNRSGDLVDHNQRRNTLSDWDVDVYIAAILPNPKGQDRNNEWISIINTDVNTISIDGWCLQDNQDQTAPLQGSLEPGQSLILKGNDLHPIRLSNQGDILTLWDKDQNRIDRIRYKKKDVKENKAIVFNRRPPLPPEGDEK